MPTGFSDTDKVTEPLLPWFGKIIRPVILTAPDECRPAGPPAFSTDPSSDFYRAAKEVQEKVESGTEEERLIARFWADDPRATGTPPGHWVNIATKYVRSKNLAEAAHGYALASLTHLDAFIAVWQSKYEHNILRPQTYIRRHIQPQWRPTLGTPQFPSYVSGHSGVSGAAGVMATAAFGDGPVVDDTLVRRGFAARTFANFDAAAREAVVSRLYGGIHYTFDNDDGYQVGVCVANKALERVAFR